MKHSEILEIITKQTGKVPTQQQLANILGMTRDGIASRIRRNVEYKLEEINKIQDFYSVNLAESSEDFVSIPVRGDVYASLGGGITVYKESKTGTYEISKKLARDIGVSLNNTEMIFARGDSMEPTIIGGDSLLVDLSKKDIYDGSIYCIRMNGQLYAKRLQKVSLSTIKIISDNKEKYDPIYIDFSKETDIDFEIIGEIRWAGRIFK